MEVSFAITTGTGN